MNFPTLVENPKNGEISEKGHGFEGHASMDVPVSTTIQGIIQ